MTLAQWFQDSIGGKVQQLFTDTLTDVIQTPIDSFKGAIENIINKIKEQIKKMFEILMAPIRFIMNTITMLSNIFKSVFRSFMNAIKKIVDKIKSAIQSMGKFFTNTFKTFANSIRAVVKILVGAFKSMVKFLVMIYKTVVRLFKKLFDALSHVFNNILFYMMCALMKMFHFSTCSTYYFMDFSLFFTMLPMKMMIWIFPELRRYEEMANDMVNRIDKYVYYVTYQFTGTYSNGKKRPGFHINQYPFFIINKCYRCTPLPGKDPDLDIYKELMDFYENTKDNFAMFAIQIFIILLISHFIYTFAYTWWQQQRSCSSAP
jgi:hypothetical protein